MADEFDMTRYMAALMKLAGTKPGQIEVEAQHADECAIWKNGKCDCDYVEAEK